MSLSSLTIAWLLIVAPAMLLAQERDRFEPAVEFDYDYPPETSHRLNEQWSFGAIADVDTIVERNLDLDSGADDDRVTVEPRLAVALAYEPTDHISALAEVEFRRGIVVRDETDTLDPQAELRLQQAYVTFSEFQPGFTLRVGRQNFEDERDWWYDEELDAVRLFYRSGAFGLEVSAAHNPGFGNDFLDRSRTARTDNYFIAGRYAWTDAAELSAFVVIQKDGTDSHEDPVFFGVRSIGDLGAGFEHWIDAAIVRGTDDGEDIRAYGFDAGLVYTIDHEWEPNITLGVAFGSGDSDPDDGVNRDFRQTGLQGSYFYYGEVLAPELSNLWVATLGIGVEPLKDVSVDVLYHQYRQHQASETLRDVLIERDPQGTNRDLGAALDLVAAWWGDNDLVVQLVLGNFLPGDAFARDANSAFFGEFIVSYRF